MLIIRYASTKEYTLALDDAEKAVAIKPEWAKAYSRQGAALHGLGRLVEAQEAYRVGLKADPENALLKKGLADVDVAVSSEKEDVFGGMGNMFGPQMWGKIASNPKLAPFLAQPDLVAKLQAVQSNPKAMGAHMSDPRMMQIMMGLMGLDGMAASNPEEMDLATAAAEENLQQRRREEEVEMVPEVVEAPVELTTRELSDQAKALGNEAYKKKQFEAALKHYDEAYALDVTNVAILTNKSAVLFEMEMFAECINVSEKAVEEGRNLRADFKLIARAFGRMGSAYQKLGDLTNAIKFYEKSLSEHRTKDILDKLREVEAAKKKNDIESYIDFAKSDAERELGNQDFKNHMYADSVKHYAEAIKRNPKDARNYSNRAASLAKLMALPEAEKDCDEAIKIDDKFIKAYIRKAAVQFTKKEFAKCVETCNLAIEKDEEKKHVGELQGQIQRAYMQMQTTNQEGTSEEKYKRAMQDPEIQQIMSDPVMQSILQQMKDDPMAAQDHMKNPVISAKIRKLINAGIIQTR